MKRLTALFLCITLSSIAFGRSLPIAANAGQQNPPREAVARSRTDWNISPSFKFDTLCFLNTLTGDDFYRRYYADEYASFAPRLTPPARAALASLKRKIKDDNKNIISAFLCLYFSATEDQTLDDMLRTLNDSRLMKRNLKETVYYNKDGWSLFESVRGELKTIFTFLKTIAFEAYWQRNILPKIERRIAEVKGGLTDYDVVSEVEMHLGQPLASNKITIYLLYYSQPHGIKITGTRFICDVSYPLRILVQNAVHEMMHPPYDLKRDRELSRALDGLQADGFLMDKIKHHNPSFGYNSFEGYVEEDCVRALDQLIGERFKLAVEAHRRWREEDEGMHVLAVALYSLMKQESYNSRKELFRDFLLRVIRSGKLKAGNIKSLYDAFYRV